MLPPVAAVVLNYRTPDATIAAVRSLEDSERPFQHLIVVDNGSDDGSPSVLRRALPGATVLESGANLGFSGGVNVGIRAALGSGAGLVMLVNSDLMVQRDTLSILEAALSTAPHAGIAGPLIVTRTDPPHVESGGICFSRLTGRMRHQSYGGTITDAQRGGAGVVDGLSGAAVLIRADVFRAVGLFDERYFFSYEDLEFCLRSRSAGFSTICVPAAMVRHQGGLTLGATSPRRLYFGLRNHLLLCTSPHARVPFPMIPVRAAAVLALNLAYAARRSDIPTAARLTALRNALFDHWQRRYGPD